MPQIMVDLNAASADQLRGLGELLIREANRMGVSFPAPLKAPDPAAVFGIPPVNAAPPAPLSPSEPNAAAGGAAPFAGGASTGAGVAAPPNAPTTSPAPAPAPTNLASVQLDRDGLPHDRRIHSETPTIKADGRWRQRRNLDNATLVAVEAELRKAYPAPLVAAPAAPVIPPPPPAPVSLPPPPPPPVVAGTDAPAAPVIPPPPPPAVVAPSVPGGAPAEQVSPFRALMKAVEGQTGEGGKFSAAVMKPIHAQFGATGWADYCVKCQAHIPAVMDIIKGM